MLATFKNLYAIIIYIPFFLELGEFGGFFIRFSRKSFLGFSQAGLVSTKKVREFSVFFRVNLKFLLKILKRNAKFSKPQNSGKKVAKRKEKKNPWSHRPLFLSPIGQILAHKENAAWIGRSELQKPFKEKII